MQTNEYENEFPGGKADCICGSGLRFKGCCKSELERRFEAGGAAGARDSENASPLARLKHARAGFSQYWVWHKVHLRLLNLSDEDPLVLVDVRALADLLERVIYRTHDAGQRQAIFDCLRRLTNAVDHPQWANEIVLLRVLAHLYPEWNGKGQEAAKNELRALKVDAVANPELLEIYLDLLEDELGLDAQLKLQSRLSVMSETPGPRLQYAASRALTLHLHGDHDSAAVQLREAITAYEGSRQEKDAYGRLQFAKALTIAGAWGLQLEAPFERAQAAFLTVLEDGSLNVAGRGNVEFERASSFGLAGKWSEALSAYERAQAMEFSPRTTIAQADVLAHLDRLSEAKALLSSLDYEALPTVLKADFCLSFATYSILRNDPSTKELEELGKRLEALDVCYPAFAAQLSELRQQLVDKNRSLLEEEVRNLRSQLGASRPATGDDDSIRRAVAAHRELPPRRLTRALPLSQELPDFLARICVEACSQLVDQRQLLSDAAQSREDTYTAFLTSLLRQRVAEFQWAVSEQDLGGLPGQLSAERGRRDLVFRRPGDAPFAILEAVRCKGLGDAAWSNVDEHLQRMVTRYDATGASVAILVTYAEVIDFESFVHKYLDHLSRDAAGHLAESGGPTTKLSWRDDGLLRRAVQVVQTLQQLADTAMPVTHIIVHLPRENSDSQ